MFIASIESEIQRPDAGFQMVKFERVWNINIQKTFPCEAFWYITGWDSWENTTPHCSFRFSCSNKSFKNCSMVFPIVVAIHVLGTNSVVSEYVVEKFWSVFFEENDLVFSQTFYFFLCIDHFFLSYCYGFIIFFSELSFVSLPEG